MELEQKMEKIGPESFQCSEGGPMTIADAVQLTGQIRRFQMLSSDCEAMRDNIAKIAPSTQQEAFDAQVGVHKLLCFKEEGGKTCRQLNCHNSAKDTEFRRAIAEFKHRLE